MNRVAVIGCGTVGRGWALCFARAGFRVSLYDLKQEAALQSRSVIAAQLGDLAKRAYIADATEILDRVEVASRLGDALHQAFYAQESITEDAAAKLSIFEQMDREADEEAILASSTSAIMPSAFLRSVRGRQRCLIAHPFNPVHLIPLVEVVPSPWTDPGVIERTLTILRQLGRSPVVIRNEVPGFVGNRLQAAVVNEAMHLVSSGVISPEDLDRCMRDGLGRRWAFYGPFETMDLNAPAGFADYARKFGISYQELGASLGVGSAWDHAAVAQVESWRRAHVSIEALPAAQARRDELLIKLNELLEGIADGAQSGSDQR